MSYHRAYINCMRCYELEGQISQEEDKLVKLRLKDSQHQARNEAMKSMEPKETGYSSTNGRTFYENSLGTCISCDYSKPSMAQFLKSNDKKIASSLESPEPTEKAHNYRANVKSD